MQSTKIKSLSPTRGCQRPKKLAFSNVLASSWTCSKYFGGARRVACIALAGLFFALGVIGILLPGLPTTPFMLLTSYFLARSWPRMQRMLLGNKLFGPILRHWQQHRAVEPRVKLQAVFLVGLAVAWLLLFSSLPVTQLLAVLAFVSIGLLTIYWLPTVKQKP